MKVFDIKEVTRLLQSRRSIYPNMYSGEVIDEKIIGAILENANWAPTHALTEPWRFTVFSGQGLKKLADFQSDLYRQVTTKNGTYDEAKFQKLASKPLLASHIISIGMKRSENERIPEVEEIAAVSCAVQNMYLTATACGVGCYWGSGGVTYWEEAKLFFGLGKKTNCSVFYIWACPKPNGPKAKENLSMIKLGGWRDQLRRH